MSAPARYRYDPRWELIVFCWAIAAGVPVAVSAGGFPRTIGIAGSLVFAGFGILLTLRRVAFPRSLVLDDEGLWLPSGFLRMSVRRITFADISAVWEAFLPSLPVLCLRCHGRTFEVVSFCLPDTASYQAVCRRICSHLDELRA